MARSWDHANSLPHPGCVHRTFWRGPRARKRASTPAPVCWGWPWSASICARRRCWSDRGRALRAERSSAACCSAGFIGITPMPSDWYCCGTADTAPNPPEGMPYMGGAAKGFEGIPCWGCCGCWESMMTVRAPRDREATFLTRVRAARRPRARARGGRLDPRETRGRRSSKPGAVRARKVRCAGVGAKRANSTNARGIQHFVESRSVVSTTQGAPGT